MFLDSNPIAVEDQRRGPANSPAASTNSRRNVSSPAPTSGYSRVMDEVSGAENSARAATTKAAPSIKTFSLWQDSDFSFGDFLDVINPLQHIPIVSTIYRNLSGDRIGMAPRVIGGALWGRIGGFVAGVINSVVEWLTGKDIGDHIFAAIWGKPSAPALDHAVARAPDTQLEPPAHSQGVIPRDAGAPSSTQVEKVAVPGEVPLTPTGAQEDSRLHSAIAPTNLISSQISQSFYRYLDDLNERDGARVRLKV